MSTLSTTAPHCEIASRTDPGRVRSANEDAVRFDANLGLAILRSEERRVGKECVP